MRRGVDGTCKEDYKQGLLHAGGVECQVRSRVGLLLSQHSLLVVTEVLSVLLPFHLECRKTMTC